MSKIEVEVVTMPAAWASYLVNGDASSLTESEVAAADAYTKGVTVVGVHEYADATNEPRFTRAFRIFGGTSDAGEVLDYTVHLLRENAR
jgi:hypothetical protein